MFMNVIPKITENPFLCLLDNLLETIFLWGTIPHGRKSSSLFETMDLKDSRQRLKDYVLGLIVGADSVAYTEEYIRDNKNLFNAQVGSRDIVVAYNNEFESVGIFYNDTGEEVTRIDCSGESDQGRMARVETGMAAIY